MKKIAVLFGGESAEHEVSVVTGLQVLENIDRDLFDVYPIYVTQKGILFYQDIYKRDDFNPGSGRQIYFSRDGDGAYFSTRGLFSNKVYVELAYLALHGGKGESGQTQGFLEMLGIPYTSPSLESSAFSMNKVATKEILDANKILNVPYVRVFSKDIEDNVDSEVDKVLRSIKLPLIIKPAHLGSSIGVKIARTTVELKKYFLETSQMDTEILVEKLMKKFVEYNISIRNIDGKMELSEIERPKSEDEILSFADKYERGGKKTGGMESLSRELPAKVTRSLRKQVEDTALEVYRILRMTGVVRIDFMVSSNKLYVTEVNPIPGSMSFYLWEASGIDFKRQITESITQAIKDNEYAKSKRLEYKSDIIEKFVKSRN